MFRFPPVCRPKKGDFEELTLTKKRPCSPSNPTAFFCWIRAHHHHHHHHHHHPQGFWGAGKSYPFRLGSFWVVFFHLFPVDSVGLTENGDRLQAPSPPERQQVEVAVGLVVVGCWESSPILLIEIRPFWKDYVYDKIFGENWTGHI